MLKPFDSKHKVDQTVRRRVSPQDGQFRLYLPIVPHRDKGLDGQKVGHLFGERHRHGDIWSPLVKLRRRLIESSGTTGCQPRKMSQLDVLESDH